MVSKKIKKILIGATVISALIGMNSQSKLSTGMLLLGSVSGSTYLFIADKPWDTAMRRRHKLSSIVIRHRRLINNLRSCSNKCNALLSLEELQIQIGQQQHELSQLIAQQQEARVSAERIISEARELAQAEKLTISNEQESLINKLKQEKQLLSKEISELRRLSNEIASNAEREARIEASKIKQQAQAEASQIVEATKANLNNTVLEPEKNAHLHLLAQIQEDKNQALSELERVQNLHEKTRTAIEKMKQAAQNEYLSIKQKLEKQAKAKYLKEMERVNEILEQMQNQVNLLTSENQLLKSELQSLDEPQYPEGYREHEVYARGIIDFYKTLGVILDYKLSLRDGDKIRVRVIPREEKVGEQQLRKFSDRLKRLFDLSNLPEINTVAGTIQFDMTLVELQTPVIELYHSVQQQPIATLPAAPQIHPEIVDVEQYRTHLETIRQREFQPPPNRFSPFEQITQTEREWVLWLYRHCQITDQNTIIYTVWRNTRGKGVTQGVGQSYMAAREKLHKIFDEAGIPRRRANNANE